MSPSDGTEAQTSEQADPAPAPASPLDVLEEISLAEVLSMRHEGTEQVDWAALVPDRSGTCPECGLPDGPKHANRCVAHPRPPHVGWVVLACLLLPLPLLLVAGPYAYGIFVPTIVVALVILSR
jgi:hypothetical protein